MRLLIGRGTRIVLSSWNAICPIWVARDDGSMVVFKISSARELDANFKENKKLVLFDVYDIESNGKITEHPIGPNGGYGLFYNQYEYLVFYPESERFPNGQHIKIENSYQTKICNMLIHESRQNDKIYLPN